MAGESRSSCLRDLLRCLYSELTRVAGSHSEKWTFGSQPTIERARYMRFASEGSSLSGKQQDRRGTTYGATSRIRQSSGSTLMIEAPWSLPVQNVTGVVELSTKTLRMFVDLGRR